MTDLEEVPDYDSDDDVPMYHFTDEERRAVMRSLLEEHLTEIERRLRHLRMLMRVLG